MIRAFTLLATLLFSFSHAAEEQKPVILVNIAPYQWFVQQIAGNSVSVEVLVPPGGDLHSFEPTIRSTLRASEAKIWFRLGDPIERKTLEALQNRSMKIIDLRQGLPLLGEGSLADPHIWLSVRLAKMQAETITDALIDLMPEKQTVFVGRLQKLLKELDALDMEIEKLLAPMEPKIVVVSHPAYGYFCRDYNLKQISIEQAGKEPSLRQLNALVQEIKLLGLDRIFAQVQHHSKSAEMLAKELDAQVVRLDPLQKEYPTMMRKIARRFAGN